MGAVTIGCDIGQRHDPSALAVVETESSVSNGRFVTRHLVRHLERLPLMTAYPDVVVRVQAVVGGVYRQLAAQSAPQTSVQVDPHTGAGRLQYSTMLPSIRLFADATGVGMPIVDLLRAAGVQTTAVFFTYGDKRSIQADGVSVSLGKGWLVSRLQALLQTGRVLLPRTAEAEALARELANYEIKIDPDGDNRFGAFKVGTHDDLVTALGLAVQLDPPPPSTPVIGGERAHVPWETARQPYLDNGRSRWS